MKEKLKSSWDTKWQNIPVMKKISNCVHKNTLRGVCEAFPRKNILFSHSAKMNTKKKWEEEEGKEGLQWKQQGSVHNWHFMFREKINVRRARRSKFQKHFYEIYSQHHLWKLEQNKKKIV